MSHHGHHHRHGPHDRRFAFDKAAKLDDPQRLAIEPAAPLVPLLTRSPDSVLLDLGTGTGFFALPIARAFADSGGAGRVIAVDIEPRMLELLGDRAEKAGLAERISRLAVREDAPEKLPIDGASVDVALLANLWHELPDTAASLRELSRVLRPGGSLWIVDWDPKGTTEIGPPLEHRISLRETEEALTAGGFKELQRHSLYLHHYVVEAKRA